MWTAIDKALDRPAQFLARVFRFKSSRSLYSMTFRAVHRPKGNGMAVLAVCSSLFPVLSFIAIATLTSSEPQGTNQQIASVALQVHFAFLGLAAAALVFNAQSTSVRRSYSLVYHALSTVQRGLASTTWLLSSILGIGLGLLTPQFSVPGMFLILAVSLNTLITGWSITSCLRGVSEPDYQRVLTSHICRQIDWLAYLEQFTFQAQSCLEVAGLISQDATLPVMPKTEYMITDVNMKALLRAAKHYGASICVKVTPLTHVDPNLRPGHLRSPLCLVSKPVDEDEIKRAFGVKIGFRGYYIDRISVLYHLVVLAKAAISAQDVFEANQYLQTAREAILRLEYLSHSSNVSQPVIDSVARLYIKPYMSSVVQEALQSPHELVREEGKLVLSGLCQTDIAVYGAEAIADCVLYLFSTGVKTIAKFGDSAEMMSFLWPLESLLGDALEQGNERVFEKAMMFVGAEALALYPPNESKEWISILFRSYKRKPLMRSTSTSLWDAVAAVVLAKMLRSCPPELPIDQARDHAVDFCLSADAFAKALSFPEWLGRSFEIYPYRSELIRCMVFLICHRLVRGLSVPADLTLDTGIGGEELRTAAREMIGDMRFRDIIPQLQRLV